MVHRLVAVLGLSFMVVASTAADTPVTGSVSVAVAANFTEAANRIALQFEKSTGHRVKLSFGSTGKFAAQIANGAPFDVLLSADDHTPRQLASAGHALDATRFTYAYGALVLWSTTPDYVDGKGDVLRRPSFAHLAIANPKLAPYGAAAVTAMQRLGVYEVVAPKLVKGESITQVYQFVSSGNAELGFIARSQLLALPENRRGSWWLVPANLHEPLRQDAVLLSHGRDSPAARAFLDFLRSAEAREIVESLGYTTGR